MKTITRAIENKESFEKRIREHFSEDDFEKIMFAYDLSKMAHRPHSRDNGMRYFEHPRSTVLILLDELKLYDTELVIGLLFHDTGEDSSLWGDIRGGYDQWVIRARRRIVPTFGESITDLLIAITKPYVDGIRFHTKQEAFDYYISGLCASEKAMLKKMIDRLDNLRDFEKGHKAQAYKQIKETKEVYIPLFEKTLHGKCALGEMYHPKITYLMMAIKEELILLEKMYKDAIPAYRIQWDKRIDDGDTDVRLIGHWYEYYPSSIQAEAGLKKGKAYGKPHRIETVEITKKFFQEVNEKGVVVINH